MNPVCKLAKKPGISRPAPRSLYRRGLQIPREQTLGLAPPQLARQTQGLGWNPQTPNTNCPTVSTRRSVVQRRHYPSGVGILAWLDQPTKITLSLYSRNATN